jgi:hypothetical protein
MCSRRDGCVAARGQSRGDVVWMGVRAGRFMRRLLLEITAQQRLSGKGRPSACV